MKTLTAHSPVAARLAALPLLSHVDERALEQLSTLMQARRYVRGARVLSSDSAERCLHLLVAGRVKHVLTASDGREIVLEHLQAPAHFGEDTLAEGAALPGEIVALTEVETLVVDAHNLAEAIRIEPALALAVIGGLASRCRATVSRLEDLAFNDATHRVMRVVLNVATASFEASGNAIIRGMTHYDIATLAGTSRETASRVLSSLAQAGVVSTQGRTITVDLAVLAQALHAQSR